MDLSTWFRQLIQSSTDSFLWTVEQFPQERYYLSPRPNRWPIARILYHLLYYEKWIALPSMQQWLDGSLPIVGSMEEDAVREEEAWHAGQGHDMATMITNFRTLRAEQLELLTQFNEHDWQQTRQSIWGTVSLKWVMTKTYQHTLEHTDEVLRAYLWWK